MASAVGTRMTEAPILEFAGLAKSFRRPVDLAGRIANLFGAGIADIVVQAVAGVDLTIATGEVVGLVGESGCGKSTLGRMAAGILPPSAGSLRFRGQDVLGANSAARRAWALGVQMIFQDPFASLNPRYRVADAVGEAPVAHGIVPRRDRDSYVADLLTQVGLDPSFRDRFPHQFSGGQRQRIGIARALAVKPEFLVCDEAVSALDVSVQAQVLNLFMELRERLRLTYIFISHNLAVVEHLSDRVAIMYLGRIVEIAPTDTLFSAPHHPYTRALLEELPTLSVVQRDYRPIAGELPSPLNPPPGCAFHPRCPQATARCRAERPALRVVGTGHVSACHYDG